MKKSGHLSPLWHNQFLVTLGFELMSILFHLTKVHTSRLILNSAWYFHLVIFKSGKNKKILRKKEKILSK